MNSDTLQFLEDRDFELLYEALQVDKPPKPELDPLLLQAIGYLLIRFQRLEYNIVFFVALLAQIARNETIATILTINLSFGKLLRTLHSLAIAVKYDRIEELDYLIRMAGRAEEIRNQVVHSVWTSRGRFKYGISRQGQILRKTEEYSIEEMKLIADQIDRIDTAFDELSWDYQNRFYEWPYGSRDS